MNLVTDSVLDEKEKLVGLEGNEEVGGEGPRVLPQDALLHTG